MTRTLLLLTVGSFCFIQDPAKTTPQQDTSDSVVQTGPADAGPAGTGPAGTGPAGTGPAGTGPVTKKDQRLVQELQEFRNQLVAVYGTNHPIIKQVDRQILVNTAKSSLIVERLLDVPFVQLELSTEPGTDSGNANGFGKFDSRRVWFSNEVPTEVAGLPDVPAVPSVSQMFAPARGIVRATGGGIFDGQMNQLRSRWTQATDAPQKEAISEELRSTIEEQFDADLEQRRQQFAELEQKLGELKQQIEKREAMRDEFVQVLSRHTELTWDGISLPSGRRTTVIATPDAIPAPPPPADNTPSR